LQDNINVDLTNLVCQDVNRSALTRHGVQWRHFATTMMPLRVSLQRNYFLS